MTPKNGTWINTDYDGFSPIPVSGILRQKSISMDRFFFFDTVTEPVPPVKERYHVAVVVVY
jgi:hypothetical protein